MLGRHDPDSVLTRSGYKTLLFSRAQINIRRGYDFHIFFFHTTQIYIIIIIIIIIIIMT